MDYLKLTYFIILFFIQSIFANASITFIEKVQIARGLHTTTVGVDTDGDHVAGITFHPDGTKMFAVYNQSISNFFTHVSQYDLSTPFDISTSTFAGDDKKCRLTSSDTSRGPVNRIFDLKFSKDGTKLFVVRGQNGENANDDRVFRYDLSAPYDLSTCQLQFQTDELDAAADDNMFNGSTTAGDATAKSKNTRLQALDFNNDGTILYLLVNGYGSEPTRLLQYNLTTPYDIESMTLDTNEGIELASVTNFMGMQFSPDGKRFWAVQHGTGVNKVFQYSLSVAYSSKTVTEDGEVNIQNLGGTNFFNQPRGVAFSANGLIMFIGTDRTNNGNEGDHVSEFDLICPYNIIVGAECKSYTSKDRTAMAEAQAELAKRTINLSTNSALNRLKWIRRNKDKQNLSNQNIKLNFSNNLLSSLNQLPISPFKKVAFKKNKSNSDQKYFYWSEGSVAIGKVGDTSIASSKHIDANSLTFGFDNLTDKSGIRGFAFRFGNDETTLNLGESELDSETFNITYYSSAPMKNDNKLIDRIFGIGKIRSDIHTSVDGKKFTADRNGNQIYGTIKIKDEFRKKNFTLIPSGQFDIGHSLLDGYEEIGTNGGIIADKQHVQTKNLRATLAVVEDLSNEKYEFKRHGKIEYLADIDRSSDFKYKYIFDKETSYSEKLHVGSLHNINAEIGLDLIFPNRYSIFLIYERNQALGSSHNENLHIALGYLPYEGAEYAFTINGSENLLSKLEFKKNVNGLNLSFNVNDDLTNLGDNREANITLNKVF